jgi:catechol 2,3-dioxygenase-like lactoylglutathione lyase family enzyme
MESMRITNLLFWVQENRLSEKFYKKLGFTVKSSTDDASIMSLGDFGITLVNMRDEEKFNKDSLTAEKGRGMYLYISVENVDVAYKELLDAGFQPSTKPKDWEWGNREFILKDPDGYKLCFWNTIK